MTYSGRSQKPHVRTSKKGKVFVAGRGKNKQPSKKQILKPRIMTVSSMDDFRMLIDACLSLYGSNKQVGIGVRGGYTYLFSDLDDGGELLIRFYGVKTSNMLDESLEFLVNLGDLVRLSKQKKGVFKLNAPVGLVGEQFTARLKTTESGRSPWDNHESQHSVVLESVEPNARVSLSMMLEGSVDRVVLMANEAGYFAGVAGSDNRPMTVQLANPNEYFPVKTESVVYAPASVFKALQFVIREAEFLSLSWDDKDLALMLDHQKRFMVQAYVRIVSVPYTGGNKK